MIGEQVDARNGALRSLDLVPAEVHDPAPFERLPRSPP